MTTTNDDRPALSAALLAQALSVERGRCWLHDAEGVTVEYACDETVAIVTLAGRDAKEDKTE